MRAQPAPHGVESVGAVIVHFHRERDVASLVEDLVATQGLSDEQIVIVDNGSTNGLLSRELEVVGRSPRVISADNVGYAAGMNRGVAALPANLDQLLLLTHEVKLPMGAVTRLATEVQSSPMTIVGPLLVTADGLVWSAGGELSRVRRLPQHAFQGARVTDAGDADRACAWLDGAVIAVARSTYDMLGGLDERYFLYGEDVDFGARARARGVNLKVVGSVTAYQEPSQQIDPYLWTRNPFLYFRTHHHRVAWILWLASCLFGMGRDYVLRRDRGSLHRRAAGLRAGVANRGGPPA